MKPHNIKTYTSILEVMPESEIHHHLIMIYFVPREPDPEQKAICETILAQRFGQEFFDNHIAQAAADSGEIMKQRKRLHGALAEKYN